MELHVFCGDEQQTFSFSKGQSIADILKNGGILLRNACGGKGICKQCAIKLIHGQLPVTASDVSAFSPDDIRQGKRLACRAYPTGDCTIEVTLKKSPKVLLLNEMVEEDEMPQTKTVISDGIGVAIDIGTTTIAMASVDLSTGKVLHTKGLANSQRMYGSDVISRIQASNDGKGSALKVAVQRDLLIGLSSLLAAAGQHPDECPKKMVISCNTTMRRLLLGEPCESLGVFPFEPGDISLKTFDGAFVLDDVRYANMPVTFLPGISAFIGADVVSGMAACDFIKSGRKKLLMDLGTNGELALYDGKTCYVTSTAAGPAFEGGSLTCGSEAIATLANLLDRHFMDHNGLLSAPYFAMGFPVVNAMTGKNALVTQADVRQLQLAIAAMRTGMEILLEHAGMSPSELDMVYLSGGMGFSLDMDKALRVGLLPSAVIGRITPAGNTSLKGAIRYMTENVDVCAPILFSQEVILANEPDFDKRYVQYMTFPH